MQTTVRKLKLYSSISATKLSQPAKIARHLRLQLSDEEKNFISCEAIKSALLEVAYSRYISLCSYVVDIMKIDV